MLEYLLILLLLLNFSQANYMPTRVEKLLDKIFDHHSYNLMVRPESDKITGETIVYTELKVLQIDLDEKFQELVSIVWLEMTWFDERFQWNVSEYNNITDIILPVSKIWVPDIVLQNGVGKNEYLYDMKLFNPWISHTGLITWVPEIRIHTKCTIQVSDFPFDTQRCEITFYSWAHTIKQMKILQFENKNITNTTHLNRNTEWNIFHTCAFNKTIVTSSNLEWWTTSYVLFIKRRNYYHMFNLIIPYLILTLCSVNLFLLPPETGEKISLAVSLLLTFFLNLAILTNYIPESSNELPIIASYYLFNIFWISLSLGLSVCVLNIYFKSDNEAKVPKWLKIILFIDNKEEPMTNVNVRKTSRNMKNSSQHSENLKEIKNNNPATRRVKKRSQSNQLDGLEVALSMLNERRSWTAGKSTTTSFKHQTSQSIPILVVTKKCDIFDTLSKRLSSSILKLFNELVDDVERKHDRLLVTKTGAVRSLSVAATVAHSEWRVVGRRVDRVLFIISLIVVIGSQVIFFWKFYNKNLLPQCNACECGI